MTVRTLLLQYLTLSLYALFVGFTFCDGFRLRTSRKLVFFAIFGAIAIFVLRTTGEFRLAWILPVPTLLAFGLCWVEGRKMQ